VNCTDAQSANRLIQHQKIQRLIQSAFAVTLHSSQHYLPRRTLSIDTALMWDILCHKSTETSSTPHGEGLFDSSFLQPTGQKDPDQVTVETEIFHHSARAVDTSDGGQALPPYSSTVHNRTASENSEDERRTRNNSVPGDSGPGRGPLLREPWAWAGSGFRGDVSFMDVTHDPFFQFQDQENPYGGIWKFGNL
jgi:hypothetical protein